jgi:DNA-nicking Smr family endonuclease
MASPPDEEDFRKGVEPLPAPRRQPHQRPRPAPVARESPIASDQELETGEELAFLRPGLSSQTLRRLRRGHWVVEASLDLHGLNRSQAAAAVREFLGDCRARRLGCVRVVHGKGLGSHNREPVLKGKVYHWLKIRDEVLAFSQAPAAHGGAGAVLVLLKN